MRPSRRDVLQGGAVLGAAALGGPVFFPSRRAAAATPLRVAGTTLERTILRNDATANAGGYRLLRYGAGEPHLVRKELGGVPSARRAAQRVPVVVFSHITDTHVVDAQSPARVEFTDRYNDAPTTQLIFESAYRPQEMLTTQLGDAAVRGLRAIRRGPVSGRAPEFAVCTGDNIDNAQYNELRQFMALLDGGLVVPDSGDLTLWEGVQDADTTTYDVHYWHPEGTPGGALPVAGDDNPRRLYGFPTVPGLLDAARRPFRATGIGLPWYSAFGNHDPLVQGNVAPNPVFNTIATGRLKFVGLPAGVSAGDIQQGIANGDPGALGAAFGGPARPVTADPDRRLLSRAEIMAEHFITTGTPVGHGWSQQNVADDTAYYAFDHGPIRCVVLDTCDPLANNSGSLDRAQFSWLQGELVANSKAKGGSRDRLIVVFSHHPPDSMTNEIPGLGETERRALGPEVVALLLEHPNVVLWVNGHTHTNKIIPRPRATGGGGFWEVNTAAHIDFPSQSRVVEIVDNLDGTLSVFTTVVDGDAPLSYGGRIDTPRALASLARELGANDWQSRDDSRRGAVEARNAELIVPAPFELRLDRGGRAAEAVPSAPRRRRCRPPAGSRGRTSSLPRWSSPRPAWPPPRAARTPVTSPTPARADAGIACAV